MATGTAERKRSASRETIEAAEAEVREVRPDGHSRSIPLREIRAGENPRSAMDPAGLQELTESIKAKGVLMPIRVIELAPDARRGTERYMIVAGHRRYMAAQAAGLEDIPAIVGVEGDIERVELALVENLQREDMNPIDVGESIEQLIQHMGRTVEMVAAAIGKSREWVSNMARLAGCPDQIKRMVRTNELTGTHARALLRLPTNEAVVLAETAVKEKWSTHRTEDEVARMVAEAEEARQPRLEIAAPAEADVREVDIDFFIPRVQLEAFVTRGSAEPTKIHGQFYVAISAKYGADGSVVRATGFKAVPLIEWSSKDAAPGFESIEIKANGETYRLTGNRQFFGVDDAWERKAVETAAIDSEVEALGVPTAEVKAVAEREAEAVEDGEAVAEVAAPPTPAPPAPPRATMPPASTFTPAPAKPAPAPVSAAPSPAPAPAPAAATAAPAAPALPPGWTKAMVREADYEALKAMGAWPLSAALELIADLRATALPEWAVAPANELFALGSEVALTPNERALLEPEGASLEWSLPNMAGALIQQRFKIVSAATPAATETEEANGAA